MLRPQREKHVGGSVDSAESLIRPCLSLSREAGMMPGTSIS
jgi:hypothetical protein